MAWNSVTIEYSDGQVFYIKNAEDEARLYFKQFEEMQQLNFDKITSETTHQWQLRKMYGNQKEAKPLKHAEVWNHYAV